jgi:hypothetical protein
MFDELDYLRESPDLQRLLGHYAEAGAADREAWQDRLMELEGVEPRELVRLHGLLLVFNWVEQNTGNTSACRSGVVPACYRITAAGLRATKLARGPAEGEADVLAGAGATPETAPGEGGETLFPKRQEQRKAKTVKVEKADTSDAPLPAEVAGEPIVSVA